MPEAPLRGRTPLETGLQMLLRHVSYRLRAALRRVVLPVGPDHPDRIFRGAARLPSVLVVLAAPPARP